LHNSQSTVNFEVSRGELPRISQRVMASQAERPAMPDRVLVERIAAGDERALGALYDRHGGTAYSLALAIVGERADAEEVVVDAFGQAWRTAGQFDPARGSVAAWLATITRARALDLVRARGRRARILTRAARESTEGLATPLAAAGDDPGMSVEREETRRLVEQSLDELPEAQRRVIELAYFAGLTQTEIAAELREPLGTIKTRMRAGMEKLRGSLIQLLSGGRA
jgi:RNA polymerase sigma-70 factor (ECF subfamily)